MKARNVLLSAVDYTSRANVEALVLQGAGNLSGTGNALANSIFGNIGDNAINGGAGVDRLAGDAGNDTFIFPAGQANGDSVVDFVGNGGGRAMAVFIGFGTTAQGATFTKRPGQSVADPLRPRPAQRGHHIQQRCRDRPERRPVRLRCVQDLQDPEKTSGFSRGAFRSRLTALALTKRKRRLPKRFSSMVPRPERS